jgi:cytochrome P450
MSDSGSMIPQHPSVTDWVRDFDHTDPAWTENPFPIWEQLRAVSPVVHTDRFLGCYLPTTYEAVKEIAYDTEHFSSRRVIVRDIRPEQTASAPPITSDPPAHKPAKQLLLPPFTPDAMKKLEPRVRAICNELIDEFIADGKCDAAARYTKHIPVRAIAHMLGIPEKDGELSWSAIGSSLWHLAKTPANRDRLIAEPELMPLAVEELLRAYSPVTMAHEVMKETTVSGCPVKPGNMVLLSFPAANRDPAMFPDADKVVTDRKENRHAAFGLGIHRCVGSNLARMEMTAAIEEWLKRIPDFRLDPAGKVTWSEGTVRGPRQLPMLFGKAH